MIRIGVRVIPLPPEDDSFSIQRPPVEMYGDFPDWDSAHEFADHIKNGDMEWLTMTCDFTSDGSTSESSFRPAQVGSFRMYELSNNG